VSETASTAGASEGHSGVGETTAQGSPSEGSSGGTQTADSFAGERTQLEARARTEQSRADRAEAQLRELQAQLAGSQGSGEQSGEATGDPAVAALEARFASVEQMLKRATLEPVSKALRDEFSFADDAIFERFDSFESPEALRAAAETSHAAIKAKVDAEVAAQVEALKEEFAKQGFRLPRSPEGANEGGGDPTPAELAAMTPAEFAEVPEEVVDRVLRSAS